MNDPKEILSRLLKQYPVSSLRDYFDIKVTGQDSGIRELFEKGMNEEHIISFADANFEFCKQHVYVFEYKMGSFPRNLSILGEKPIFTSILNGKNTLTYLAKVSFLVYDVVGRREEQLEYLWPIRVQYFYIAKSKSWILLLKISILEKSLNDITGGRVIKLGREFNEKEIVENINLDLYVEGIELQPIDLTKGVKSIIESDIVDFGMAKFRKSKSISTEVMDLDYTIKKHNPEAYEQMMSSPIEKTTCKFSEKNDEFVSHFLAEPQQGMLTFSLFSPSLNSVDNVVNLILKENF
jgi:hypothetical protein